MALLLALRGTVFVYQGEELGLDEAVVPFEQMKDPFGIAHWPLVTGRDGCRTPMPWAGDAPNAGFSAHAPWLPVWPAHQGKAVDRQSAEANSMLSTTRQLIRLRQQHPALRVGELEVAHVDDDLLHLVRRSGQTEMHAVFNLGGTARTMAMPRADARTQWCGGARPTPTTLDLPPGAAWFGLGDA
jgi:alpha-glucosidase